MILDLAISFIHINPFENKMISLVQVNLFEFNGLIAWLEGQSSPLALLTETAFNKGLYLNKRYKYRN